LKWVSLESHSLTRRNSQPNSLNSFTIFLAAGDTIAVGDKM